MKGRLPNKGRKIAIPEAYLENFLERYTSKLEQKFVAQTHQLKTITDNATSCLFMMDSGGRTTFMNPSAGKITGYSLNEIRDRNLHNVLHPTETKKRRKHLSYSNRHTRYAEP